MPVETQLNVKTRDAGEKTIIFDLSGDLTRQGEEEMISSYTLASRRGTIKFIYNFARVGDINSTGIAILIGIISEARKSINQKIIVCNLNPHYEKVFKMVGLPKFIEIVTDEKQALEDRV